MMQSEVVHIHEPDHVGECSPKLFDWNRNVSSLPVDCHLAVLELGQVGNACGSNPTWSIFLAAVVVDLDHITIGELKLLS